MKNLITLCGTLLAAFLTLSAGAAPGDAQADALSAPAWIAGGAQHALANSGDGIFTPTLTIIANDKTDRPFTADIVQPEPRFADLMKPGTATGSSYVIKFPTGDVGGDCIFTGKGRYFIESTGTLTFQIITQCGQLKRGYNFMVCKLNEALKCREAPWWYFRGRSYQVSAQGIAVNGQPPYGWLDSSQAEVKLQKMRAHLKVMHERFINPNDPHVVHARLISCRFYHPERHAYEIHETATTCLLQNFCSGMPNVAALPDGDPIDWNSPVGDFIKAHNKITDPDSWTCWLRTQ